MYCHGPVTVLSICLPRHPAITHSTELVLDAAVPLPGSNSQPKLLQRAGVKFDFKF